MHFLTYNPSTSALLTDFYQLTMLEAYLDADMHAEAVFEFYVRRLPPNRNFLVACGLSSILTFLEQFHFSAQEIAYLEGTGIFSAKLLKYLGDCSFTGDVFAMPEGTIFFANEPVIRVIAPIALAQLVETRLITFAHFETLVCSKAARCMLAAAGKSFLVDFGLRRAHGEEAGLLAARSSYVAGFAGTSNVLAGAMFGMPLFGTMAHSYIEAFADEELAFLAFARANPSNVTFLIDTYDTLRGALNAVKAAEKLSREGIRVNAVRLDSGDILKLSKEVRQILDEHGFPNIKIFASGDLDEYALDKLNRAEAPINGFGIGTKLNTSADGPYLECAYKLMEYDGRPTLKKSPDKSTLPGRKQVFRCFRNDVMTSDTIALERDNCTGTPLLQKVMEKGRRVGNEPDLTAIAAHTKKELESLPADLRRIEAVEPYHVEIAPGLLQLREDVEASLP
ncbi:MAG: Nicotinate phosphoribosyltransferase [Syntrophus sp. SKADARSKE-3]|nr:Nicotinate phosphoribosyltransferase [Syntrophus sp. SKADARSKE-3]